MVSEEPTLESATFQNFTEKDCQGISLE